ncbi:putative 5-dehydro-4-deoxyglucarate dehydratase [Actinoplanes philippinensis]|uniref:Probable 5-dehydro-4-deoxyglucarate dehydratase n=1 Tax=Actinoplanes philippinensis TaxID=35752 RepID=A0A1I2AB26_9ACTN|nr:putative 5-dehydro-4-deoxyglucarate dehydratase [Actinoplanes philippinensis]SFE40947.1 5-dehydro-4-deoxyglucarate dehydratase [Actinoplanes philippinensis]
MPKQSWTGIVVASYGCFVNAIPPLDLAARLASGLLSFPVTHFDDRLAFDESRYREHLAWQASFGVAGLFAAGGTGEGFSLTSSEIDTVVRAAVDEVGARVPVIAPATGSTAQAVAQAQAAEAAGAAGLLLFPPYLTEASQSGLIAHVDAVCRATGLGVIVYSRANAVLEDVTVAELADRNPTLIGLKDGVGDIERMTRTYAKVGDRLIYVGGLPTAETFALPLLQLGVSTYSSALYNFLPEFALRFYAAVRAQDRAAVYGMLNDFVIPYLDIRDRARGYAVSIIKAGLTAVGRDGGRVRPPLTDLTADERSDLGRLIDKVRP